MPLFLGAQLSFDHVRVPREAMLMRFAKVRLPACHSLTW